MKRQSGITVVEILVGLALSLIILAGVMHIFINNKQTYRVQEAFARLQENGRFAINFMTKDLRMAGYMGCAGKTVGTPDNRADYYPNDGIADDVATFDGSGVRGYKYSDLPIQLSNTSILSSSNVVDGTDIVQIKRASSTGARVRLLPGTNPNNTELKLDKNTAFGMFQQYDILFVSDCKTADIFITTGIGSNAGSPYITLTHAIPQNLSNTTNPYGEDAEVFKLINATYYVGLNSANEPALFRQSLGNADTFITEELVEGVEDMQLLYGEDLDGDGTPNRYVDLDDIPPPVVDWNNIVSIRIELGLRSMEDNLSAEPAPLPNQPNVTDRRLRRTFTTSIAIRNRSS